MPLPFPLPALPYPLWRLTALAGKSPPIAVDVRAVALGGLPTPLAGTRIAFLADLHLGPFTPRQYLERVLAQAAALDAHLYLLGGDYIERTVAELHAAADLLRVLTATGRPVVGVLGNHEWYAARRAGGPRAIIDPLENAGIQLIDNAHRFLAADGTLLPTPRPASLCIAGLGEVRSHKADPDAALHGVPLSVPRIVLTHNPDAAALFGPGRSQHRVDLMLAGHTHGGQCVFPLIGPPVTLVRHRRYARGWNQGPGFPILTSRGIGTSSLPIRIACPPEMHLLTLVTAGHAEADRYPSP